MALPTELPSLNDALATLGRAYDEVNEAWGNTPPGPVSDALSTITDALAATYAIAVRVNEDLNNLATVVNAHGRTLADHLMNHHTIGD